MSLYSLSWSKYRSEITTQTKNNNLDYLIHPTFKNNNRLFVLSFKNGNDDPFFEQQEAYEKLIEMSRNNDYTPEIY